MGVVGVVYVCPYFGKVGNYAFVCVCMCVIDRVYVLCISDLSVCVCVFVLPVGTELVILQYLHLLCADHFICVFLLSW